MATFVLVHGSRHGGWCWQRVATRLQASGHHVTCPTLTGNGEKSHLLGSMAINLDTHNQDIANHLFYEDLTDVVLVGHSYAGMVITGVAESCSDRIAQLVYLDALLPHAGEAHLDLAGPMASGLRAAIAGPGRGLVLPASGASPASYGVTDPDDGAWVSARVTDQAAATYQQPLAAADAARQLPRTFIQCMRSTMIAQFVLDRVHADPTIRYLAIDATHDVMVTDPELQSATLESVARTTA